MLLLKDTEKTVRLQSLYFDALAGGALSAKAITAMAREAGIAMTTLRRAKENLGVQSVKMGLRARWVWVLLKA